MLSRAFSQPYRLVGFALTLVMAFLIVASFRANPVDPQFDQRLFVTQVFAFDDFPALADGISSFLYSGIYNRIFTPELMRVDNNIKISAALLFVASGYLLFTSIRKPQQLPLAMLCLLLILTTRFPFGWLSTEVLSGAFLLFTLWSYTRGFPLPLTLLFLALFAYTKPDLIFSSVLVAAYLVYINAGNRVLHAGIAILTFGIFLVPAVLQNGLSSTRSTVSLHQHHAVAVERHQIIDPVPDPWAETFRYVPPVWGEHEGLFENIRHNPRVYYDFIFLSIGNTIYNIVASGVFLLIPAWGFCFYHLENRPVKIITILFFLGIIPITAFSFMHTRYLTRYYPLLLWAIYLYAVNREQASRRDWILTGYLGLVLLYQLVTLPSVLDGALWEQTTIL